MEKKILAMSTLPFSFPCCELSCQPHPEFASWCRFDFHFPSPELQTGQHCCQPSLKASRRRKFPLWICWNFFSGLLISSQKRTMWNEPLVLSRGRDHHDFKFLFHMRWTKHVVFGHWHNQMWWEYKFETFISVLTFFFIVLTSYLYNTH